MTRICASCKRARPSDNWLMWTACTWAPQLSKANPASASQLVPAVLNTMTLTLPWLINSYVLFVFILIKIPDGLNDLFGRIGDLENIEVLRIDIIGLEHEFAHPLDKAVPIFP